MAGERKLTPKQEKFCVEYVKCGNAGKAYRAAYDAENMAPETIRRRAYDTLEKGIIKARVAELQAPAVKEAQFTVEQHLKKLAEMRETALGAEKFGPAIQAEIARGKAAGFYVERVMHSGAITMNVDQAREELRELLPLLAKTKKQG